MASQKRKRVANAIPWEEVRQLAIQGVPIIDIATQLGVSPSTISVRASRENWPTPHRLSKASRKARDAAERAQAERLASGGVDAKLENLAPLDQGTECSGSGLQGCKIAGSNPKQITKDSEVIEHEGGMSIPEERKTAIMSEKERLQTELSTLADRFRNASILAASDKTIAALQALPVPKTWREASIAHGIVMKSLGKDEDSRPATIVAIGMGHAVQPVAAPGQVVDADDDDEDYE